MREILFKAKSIATGEWVEGHLVTRKYAHTDEVFEAHIVVDAYEQLGVMNFGTQPVLISPLADEYTDGCFRVDMKTICQYTGLTDKNGNKIWENDIVIGRMGYCGNPKIPTREIKFKVEYRNAYYRHLYSSDMYEFEVIGNIFDNADLLQ